ncbi:hypothetical protein [Streptomyces rubiginosohelvolus]|uniref:hypothetical protein n=1 Tax=Streptomyces rubiginosohelvolus TaxID=67362 RepID=UPI00382F3C5D
MPVFAGHLGQPAEQFRGPGDMGLRLGFGTDVERLVEEAGGLTEPVTADDLCPREVAWPASTAA